MPRLVAVLAVMLTLLFTAGESTARKLADLIPGLYGGDGILLATDPAADHTAHFAIGAAASINRLNQQIAAEIAVFPFSSSVSGFTFALDPALGTFVRTTETLGPLFAERAPTLGRGKLNINTSFTFFSYHEFNGDDLDHLQVSARHDPDIIGFPDVREQFEKDTIVVDVNLDVHVQIVTLAATYGLTDRLDIGLLVPIVRVDMDVRGTARVVESSANTLFPDVHTFTGGPESPDDAASGDAIGIGDVVLRAKYHLLEHDLFDFAAAMLLKLATGDEDDFLGTGEVTLRPFVVLSHTFPDLLDLPISLTPHINLGFEFHTERDDQNAVEYAIGFDAGSGTFIVAGEFLGSHEVNGDGIGDNILTASLGAKWNLWKRLLLLANVQLPLNDDGLRSKVTTTFGVEYSF